MYVIINNYYFKNFSIYYTKWYRIQKRIGNKWYFYVYKSCDAGNEWAVYSSRSILDSLNNCFMTFSNFVICNIGIELSARSNIYCVYFLIILVLNIEAISSDCNNDTCGNSLLNICISTSTSSTILTKLIKLTSNVTIAINNSCIICLISTCSW